MPDADTIAEVLLQAAREGAAVCVRERGHCAISLKSARPGVAPQLALALQVVTSADCAVQEVILQCLLQAGFGAYALLAEEDTPLVSRFRKPDILPLILVDPIDGTLAYCAGRKGWEQVATEAGYSQALIHETLARTDPELYGMVLGLVDTAATIAICMLPQFQTVFHSVNGKAFVNGMPLSLRPDGPLRVAIGRSLVHGDGSDATPFREASLEARWFVSSSPAVLWHLMRDECSAYAAIRGAFDIQLTALLAQAAGMLVADRRGRSFVPDFRDHVDGIIMARSQDEIATIAAILRQYD